MTRTHHDSDSIQQFGVVQTAPHVVEATRWRWSEYLTKKWQDIDRIFIHHGYEQQGLEMSKFVPLLEKHECCSINALGSILRKEDGSTYVRGYAGGLAALLYQMMQRGERGEAGKGLYDTIKDFQRPGAGRAGRTFWQLIWRCLVACRYLTTRHNGSFRVYVLDAFAKFARRESVTDEEFLDTTPEEWRPFLDRAKPWKPLKGIGPNTFEFIFGDLVDARFASDSYKLDSANVKFLRVTGIADLIDGFEQRSDLDRQQCVIRFMRDLGTDYTLRQINAGIYTYCSETEGKHFGYCRSSTDCGRCGVNTLCDKRFNITRAITPSDRGRNDLFGASAAVPELMVQSKVSRGDRLRPVGVDRKGDYERFWRGLLALPAARTPLHEGRTPLRDHHLNLPLWPGHRGLDLIYVINQHSAKVNLFMDFDKNPGGMRNKRMFDGLHLHQQEIEQNFGGSLSWERMDDKRGAKIEYTVDGFRGLDDRDSWPAIQTTMVDAMNRLEKALRQYLDEFMRPGRRA